MKRLGFLAAFALLIAGVVGPAQRASAQADPQGQQGGRQQAGAVALGGLINAVLQNTQLNLSDVLNNTNVEVVDLNNVLNGAQINVLSDILNNSPILNNNTVVVQNILNNSLNNNTVLQNFLNNNNVDVSRVIALGDVNVLSAPLTLYLFSAR